MGEIKQTNFRLDVESADRFRRFCEEYGMNHAQGFEHIMNVLEMDKARSMIPEREVEIEEFQRHAKLLVSAYLNSLEIAKAAEERAIEKFSIDLKSKDQVIAEQHEKLEKLKMEVQSLQNDAKDAERRSILAEKMMDDAERRAGAATEALEDKKQVVSMLTGKLKEAEDKAAGYDALKNTLELRTRELEEAKRVLEAAQKDAEIEKERAVRNLEKEMGEKLSEAEKEVLRSKAQMAEAALEAERRIAEIRRESDTEIARMREEMETLRNRIAEAKVYTDD